MMKIIAVDDERIALEGLLYAIQSAAPEALVQGFRYPEDALAYVQEHGCDVAFLDVEMADMNGVELAHLLKQINPDVNLIFSTGFEQYRKEAFELHSSGYITKPVTVEKVQRELADLRRPVHKRNRIRVQTFGNFEAYLNEKPLAFKYSKTKELFAYLVDRRGALCTVAELMVILFEEEKGHEAYMKSLRKDLLDTMEAAGFPEVVTQQRGKLGITADMIDCDLYDWYNGKRSGLAWGGEYMAQYSWAEYTSAMLERMMQKER